MNILERIARAYAKNEPVPLKGKAKLILEDARDGSRKVVESENMITNAVASILASNWNARAEFSQLLPLRKLYAGVLMFENAITENANNYAYPAQTSNPLTAHAGTEPNTTASTKRGSPVSAEWDIQDTSISMSWLWDTSQGNGPISSVCLCPEALGNLSLEPVPTDGQFSELMAQRDTENGVEQFNGSRAACILHPFAVNEDGKTGRAIYWSGDTFEEIMVRHDWLAFGIMRNKNDYQEITSRTATVRSFTAYKASFFEDSEYYYLYEVTNTAGTYGLKIDKIRKLDFTVTQADITISDVTLYTGTIGGGNNIESNRLQPWWPFDGTYLYIPNASANGFVAINPNNSSDKWNTDGTVTIPTQSATISGDNSAFITPVVIGPRVIVGANWIINGDKVYQTAVHPAYYTGYGSNRYNQAIRKGASVYLRDVRRDTNSSAYHTSAPILMKAFLSSINNIEPVQKSAVQTMRLIYTVSEITGA